MADTVNARLKAIRTALKVSQRDFAKGIYLSQSFYAEIELENRKVNNRHIQLIVNRYNANRDWILTGQGEMFNAPPPDIKLELITEIFKQLNEQYQDYLLLQSKELLKMQTGNKNNKR